MKTCSNCHKTNISDKYKFCPQCGTALVAELWREKYRELLNRRNSLCIGKELYIQFKNERNQLFYILNNDAKYKAEISAYKTAMRIKSIVQFLIYFSLFSATVVMTVLAAKGNINLRDLPTLFFIFLLWGMYAEIYHFFRWRFIPFIWKKTTKMKLINLKEFIDRNIMLYKNIVENSDSKNFMERCLKYELKSHEQLSKEIQLLIARIEQSILEIDTNLKAIEAIE